jgi:ribonucleoside-diphosphate reductase alpha chain
VTAEETKACLRKYEEAVIKFKLAQEELSGSLHELRREGVYPSPVEVVRYHLADEREGVTHKFAIGFGDSGLKGYITTGLFSDGKLGEIFIVAEKEGAFVSGLLDEFATLFSIALQSGVPLKTLINKFKHDRFEPAGMTQNPEIRTASSVIDYLMHWLELKYTDQVGGKE